MDPDTGDLPVAGKERPFGVLILGILSLILGLMAVFSGLILLTFSPKYLGWLGPVAGAVLVVLGIAMGIFGIGCFRAWSWAWVLGVVLLVSGMLLQLFSLVTWFLSAGMKLDYYNPETEAIIGILIAGIIMYYLFQPQVKAYFGRT
jgi:hypothetical protein